MGFGGGFSSSKAGGLQVVSGSDGQVLRFQGNSGKAVVGTADLKFTSAVGFKISGSIEHSENIFPANDGVHSIGSSGATYSEMNLQNVRASNVITGDLHMRNERGDWTLIEERNTIILRNNVTGERFKMVMEKIED